VGLCVSSYRLVGNAKAVQGTYLPFSQYQIQVDQEVLLLSWRLLEVSQCTRMRVFVGVSISSIWV
jgi:hypothetical protein